MAGVKNKINIVLATINKMSTRIERIEKKIDNFESRLNQIESTLNKRIEKLDNKVKYLPTQDDLIKLENRVKQIEQTLNINKKEELLRELYSKRLNILIHGLNESKQAWETTTQTKTVLAKFFTEGREIDLNSLSLVDCHRLPQQPIFKQGQKVTKPIILKLANAFDKRLILKAVSKLKKYNMQDLGHSLSTNEKTSKPVYITEHLPHLLYQQKKKLLPLFKDAKNKKEPTKWAIDGNYCLYIKDVKRTAKSINQ